MEKQTINKPVNGNNSTETSLHSMRSSEEKNALKDDSSSSDLRPEPPAKASDSGFAVDDSDQISVFEAENYFSMKDNEQNKRDSQSVNHDKTGVQRCEFSAFSRLSVSSADGNGYGGKQRDRSFHAMPTASSEASWNSQTGLLSNQQGFISIPISLRNIPSDNSRRNRGCSSNPTKWFVGLNCPCCYSKNSVQVEENLSNPKTSFASSSYQKRDRPKSVDHHQTKNKSIHSHMNSITSDVVVEISPDFRPFSSENHFQSQIGHQHRQRRHQQQGLGSFHDGVGFSFPILNQSLSKVQTPIRAPLEEPPRESLEVFQPTDGSNSMEFQQREGFGFPASPMSRITGTEDDGASDASSDLFEIDSFSNQLTCHRQDDETTAWRVQRQSLDEPVAPSVAATECYEPSEASINWSLSTADGFDRGISISASEFREIANMRPQEAERTFAGDGLSNRKSGNGSRLLLSCRGAKSVSVGPVQQQEEDRVGRRTMVDGGGGPPLPPISTTRHVSSRPYKR